MHLFYYPIADSYWLVAGVAAALLAIVVLVGPGRDRVSLRGRLVLALIRSGVVLLVALGMLRPTLVYTETHKEKATLVLLVDKSRSMLVSDSLNNKTRWESLVATLEDSVPGAPQPGPRFRNQGLYVRCRRPFRGRERRQGRPARKPAGQETAIGEALDYVLKQENGKRLLGIVLLTDGRQQAVYPRDRSAQDVAAQLRHQGFPVYPVVFGQSRGLGGVQDVAVIDFPPPAAVFVDTEMAIHGEIKVSGYVNQPIPIRVFMEMPDGKMEIIAQKEIRAKVDGELLPVDFTYTPKTAGEFKLTLEAVPQPGELVTTNNQQSSFVQVLKGGLHVLYIEGDLRLEQKFLRRSLDASRDIKADSIRLDPRHKETKPRDLIDRFKPGKYNVYILGNVDSSVFDTAELEQLQETVSKNGKGLIMLGGFHSFGPGGYSETPLANVLPVQMDKLERQKIDDPIREDEHLPGPLRMQPTPRNLGHFALALAPLSENAAAWAKLPPLEGANKFAGIKPGAIVLAEADGKEGEPLLVTQEAGGGRVLAFAGDSTWRWCMHGFDAAHKRFWRQIVLWLAHKEQVTQGNVWVRMDNTRYFPGNRVDFLAGTQTTENEPSPTPRSRPASSSRTTSDRTP